MKNSSKIYGKFISDFSKQMENPTSSNFAFDQRLFQNYISNPFFQKKQNNLVANENEIPSLEHIYSYNPFFQNPFESENKILNKEISNQKIKINDNSEPISSENSPPPSDIYDDSYFQEEEKKTKILEIQFNHSTYIENTPNIQNRIELDVHSPLSIEDDMNQGRNPFLNAENESNLNRSNVSFTIFDIEPHEETEENLSTNDDDMNIEMYEEAHLTSTSDLDILGSVSQAEEEKTPKILKTPESKKITLFSPSVTNSLLSPKHNHHTREGLLRNSHQNMSQSPIIHETIQVPTTLQGLRRPMFMSPTLKKGTNRPRMTEEDIINALAPLTKTPTQSPQPKNKQLLMQDPHQTPQKPLTNCCVAAAMGGNFRPLYTEFNKKERPKIHWTSFPGLSLSPFETPPTNVEEYLLKQKKKQESGPNAVENEAIAINFCEICKSKFTDAAQHRASELHQQRAAMCNWKDIDDLFQDLNEQFVKELDN